MKTKIFILTLIQSFAFQFTHGQTGIVDQNAKNKPEIVFIGTYHMGNQGNNVFKGEHDDILSPKRQIELQELLDKLKEFKPTKIVIERDIEDSALVLNQYQKYLEGNLELTGNETHQIGFRLAKELNLTRVYSVDWGIFPSDPLYNYEAYAKNDPELNHFLTAIYEERGNYYQERNEKLNELSILNQIKMLNSPETIESDHKGYFDIMRIGKGDEYVGANYLSWWYGRNMKILVNIIRITESNNDRILVIYGSGHMKLLTQLAKESQFYDVIDPIELLEK